MCDHNHPNNDFDPEPPPALECPMCGENVCPGDSVCEGCGYSGPEVDNSDY